MVMLIYQGVSLSSSERERSCGPSESQKYPGASRKLSEVRNRMTLVMAWGMSMDMSSRSPIRKQLVYQYIHHTIPVSHFHPIIIPIETSLSHHYPVTMGYYLMWIDIYKHHFHGIMIHIIPIVCYPISKLLSSLVSLIKHPIWPLLCHMITSLSLSGWWFGTFCIFPFSWECHNPNWTLIFFRVVYLPDRILIASLLSEGIPHGFSMIQRLAVAAPGPSNGLPKPKTALPWAGKLRPTPEEKPCRGDQRFWRANSMVELDC